MRTSRSLGSTLFSLGSGIDMSASERDLISRPGLPSSGLICQYQPEWVTSNRGSPTSLGSPGSWSPWSMVSDSTTVSRTVRRRSKLVATSCAYSE